MEAGYYPNQIQTCIEARVRMRDIGRMYPADSDIEKAARAAEIMIEVCWSLIDKERETKKIVLPHGE